MGVPVRFDLLFGESSAQTHEVTLASEASSSSKANSVSNVQMHFTAKFFSEATEVVFITALVMFIVLMTVCFGCVFYFFCSNRRGISNKLKTSQKHTFVLIPGGSDGKTEPPPVEVVKPSNKEDLELDYDDTFHLGMNSRPRLKRNASFTINSETNKEISSVENKTRLTQEMLLN